MATRLTGKLKFFIEDRGFGFITLDDADAGDVFVHVSALNEAGIPLVAEGQRMAFDLGTDRNGRKKAINLELL